ncbi:hypothetical protein Taro_031272, partial [Colocasia esculenta]|nr:hypothetical protein [Colocasia esculenta]
MMILMMKSMWLNLMIKGSLLPCQMLLLLMTLRFQPGENVKRSASVHQAPRDQISSGNTNVAAPSLTADQYSQLMRLLNAVGMIGDEYGSEGKGAGDEKVLGAGCLKVGGAGGAVEEEGGEGGSGVARDEDSWASGAVVDSTTLGSTPSEINGPGGPTTTSDSPDGPSFSTPQDSAA